MTISVVDAQQLYECRIALEKLAVKAVSLIDQHLLASKERVVKELENIAEQE